MLTQFAKHNAALAAHPLSALFALFLFGVWLTAAAGNGRAAEIIAGGSAVITIARVFLPHHA